MRQTFWCVLPKLIAMIGSSLLFVLMPLYVLGLGGSLGQTLQSVLCSSTVLASPGLLGIAVTLAYRLDVSDEGLILREPWRTRWIAWDQIASVERGSDHKTRIVSARPVDVAGPLHSRHAGGPRDTRVDIDDFVGDWRTSAVVARIGQVRPDLGLPVQPTSATRPEVWTHPALLAVTAASWLYVSAIVSTLGRQTQWAGVLSIGAVAGLGALAVGGLADYIYSRWEPRHPDRQRVRHMAMALLLAPPAGLAFGLTLALAWHLWVHAIDASTRAAQIAANPVGLFLGGLGAALWLGIALVWSGRRTPQ